jgi:hypothetical protein
MKRINSGGNDMLLGSRSVSFSLFTIFSPGFVDLEDAFPPFNPSAQHSLLNI